MCDQEKKGKKMTRDDDEERNAETQGEGQQRATLGSSGSVISEFESRVGRAAAQAEAQAQRQAPGEERKREP